MLASQQAGVASRNSKLTDFLRTRPFTFSLKNEPLEAEDWLCDTEKKLHLARCVEDDKVDFATHQLKGTVAAWWENYLAARGGESPVDMKSLMKKKHQKLMNSKIQPQKKMLKCK